VTWCEAFGLILTSTRESGWQPLSEKTLSESPSKRFADIAGVVHGGGGRARRTGDAFAESLVEDRERQ